MGGADVAKTVNEVFRPVGIGAYHGAVEVYGREWSFGFTEEGTGVFSCAPRGSSQHRYRESVAMGSTALSRREVAHLLRRLEWPGARYDLLRRNCCHWCDEFCRQLGVGPIPEWVNKLAGEIASVDDGVREAADKARESVTRARLKTAEFNEKLRDTVEAKADELRGQAEAIKETVEAKAEAIKETVEAKAEAIKESVEAKADELREQAEATWRDFTSKAEQIDQKFCEAVSDRWHAATEDWHRQRRSLAQALDGLSNSAGTDHSLLSSFGQRLLPMGFGSEQPPSPPPEATAADGTASLPPEAVTAAEAHPQPRTERMQTA